MYCLTWQAVEAPADHVSRAGVNGRSTTPRWLGRVCGRTLQSRAALPRLLYRVLAFGFPYQRNYYYYLFNTPDGSIQ